MEQLTESVVSLSVSNMRPDIDEVGRDEKEYGSLVPDFCSFQQQNAENKTK